MKYQEDPKSCKTNTCTATEIMKYNFKCTINTSLSEFKICWKPSDKLVMYENTKKGGYNIFPGAWPNIKNYPPNNSI